MTTKWNAMHVCCASQGTYSHDMLMANEMYVYG